MGGPSRRSSPQPVRLYDYPAVRVHTRRVGGGDRSHAEDSSPKLDRENRGASRLHRRICSLPRKRATWSRPLNLRRELSNRAARRRPYGLQLSRASEPPAEPGRFPPTSASPSGVRL